MAILTFDHSELTRDCQVEEQPGCRIVPNDYIGVESNESFWAAPSLRSVAEHSPSCKEQAQRRKD